MKNRWIMLLLGLVLGVTVSSQAVEWWPFGKKTEKSQAPLQLDSEPIPRGAPLVSTYAPAVAKARPGVVNIFTSKKIKAPSFQNHPLFNDPFFRRFFGIPDEGMPQGPRGRGNAPRGRENFREQTGLGSGVIVTSDGYILTNNHVIAVADEIKVAIGDGKKEYKAKLVGRDPLTDVAVVKIDEKNLPALTIADSDKLEIGDVALAIGNPFGIGQTTTMGIISALGKALPNLGGEGGAQISNFIQTDAAINPGNSGGALVDTQGRLIGINTAIISGSGGSVGIGFAIPINLARQVMSQLVKDGKVARGYLGVNIQPVTDELVEEFGLKSKEGALIGGFAKNSPAEKAGMQQGDVVIAIDGKPVRDPNQLRLEITSKAPGSTVDVKLIRNNAERTLKVKLDPLPNDQNGIEDEENDKGDKTKPDELERFGMRFESLTPEARRQINAPPSLTGVVVSEVFEGSSAEQQGVQPGDLIVQINRQSVKSSKEAQALLREELRKNKSKARVLLLIWSQGYTRFVSVRAASE